MWLPYKIYFSLPFLYAFAAALILVLLPFSGPALVSAAALSAASALTFFWRMTHRHDAVGRAHPHFKKIRT